MLGERRSFSESKFRGGTKKLSACVGRDNVWGAFRRMWVCVCVRVCVCVCVDIASSYLRGYRLELCTYTNFMRQKLCTNTQRTF